uniref:RING-type domain-containing protein n=1 Tax=Peronospora matthiolae TaxID=2874970 RepID=A0AAV1UYB4_9STRA
MNSYQFVPEPHARSTRQQQGIRSNKRTNCKSYTLRALATHVRHEIPLHVSVSTATRQEDHVAYNCTVSSVTTRTRWRVSYRYSEFLALRKKVEDSWTCKAKDCCGSCQAIRNATAAFFPKRRPAMISKWSQAIKHRRAKLENVLVHLLRCVLLPGSAMKCAHARQKLPPHVFKFLGVKRDADKRSLLHVFVDSFQSGIKNLAVVTDVSMLEHQHPMKRRSTSSHLSSLLPRMSIGADPTIAAQCAICLDAVSSSTSTEVDASSSDSPIALQCEHTFHRTCIFEWLLFQYDCPVCRAQVGFSAVTNYCRPKNQVQWWLSDFKENPLTSTAL